MKSLNLIFNFFVFATLFSCSSKNSNEEELTEKLSISSISEFFANRETQSVTIL